MPKPKNKITKRTESALSKQTSKIGLSSSLSSPVWLYDKIDRAGSFAFDIGRQDFNHKLFLEKMVSYSNMKWQDIMQQTHDDGESKHHFIAAEKLCKGAQKRIQSLRLEEYSDCIFSFSFDNKLRIFGIRDGEKFHVLWYDPKHEVCPVKK